MTLEIQTIESMPFSENSYVVWRRERRDAVVFDPGLEPELITEFLRDQGLDVVAILNTHGHADHIAGNLALKHAYPLALLLIGAGDDFMLTNPMANLSAPFGYDVISPPADRLLREGDVIELAGLKFAVLEIPGHSPGHIVYLLREEPMIVFGGDVLFRDSIGRTDFPGGSLDKLRDGIHGKLFTLPDSTVIYPGHGPVTTIGHEKQHNPFVGVYV
jgi:glyoxylase-like metal-dependent hydrolase (beta-lactamase superfamily II)